MFNVKIVAVPIVLLLFLLSKTKIRRAHPSSWPHQLIVFLLKPQKSRAFFFFFILDCVFVYVWMNGIIRPEIFITITPETWISSTIFLFSFFLLVNGRRTYWAAASRTKSKRQRKASSVCSKLFKLWRWMSQSLHSDKLVHICISSSSLFCFFFMRL